MRERYGLCCACHKPGRSVRNVIMLPFRAPQPGTGWGCLQCGIGNDGAIAVVCDACLRDRREAIEIVDGPVSGKKRLPLATYEKVLYGHDMTKHPEYVPAPDWSQRGGAFKGEAGCGVPCGLAIYPHVPMVAEEATPLVEVFLLWLPHAHPDYTYYVLIVSHLRNEDRLPPEMKTTVVFPSASHSLSVARVDPRLTPDPAKLSTLHAIGSAMIDAQIEVEDDRTAIAIARDIAIALVDGRIHAETYNVRAAEQAGDSVIGGIVLKRSGAGKLAVRRYRGG